MRKVVLSSCLVLAIGCAWLSPGEDGSPPPAQKLSRDLHDLPASTPGKPVFDTIAYGIDAAILIAGAFAGYKTRGHVEKRRSKKKASGGVA